MFVHIEKKAIMCDLRYEAVSSVSLLSQERVAVNPVQLYSPVIAFLCVELVFY